MTAARRRPRPDTTQEEPPARRARPAQDDDEQPTRLRRPRPLDDEEEPPYGNDDEEPPEDEDLEQAPARRRATRPSAAPNDADRPRRRPGGPTGPSRGAGRRPGGPTRPPGRVASGWGGYRKVRESSSEFEAKYKPSADGEVVVLLEAEPFAAFGRHWLNLPEGKRALICPASLEVDDDQDAPECPLCDVGDKCNAPKAYLNVAVLRPGQRPEQAVWEIGASISDQLQTIDKSIGRRSTLTDIYLLASSTGSGMNTKYYLEPLFEEDLDEFEVKPLTDKQLDSFELYDADLYEVPTLQELNKLADEIA